MSWHFSRALVVGYSEGICLDGAQSVPSNMTATPQVYSSSDKMTAFCNRSRSGMTCEPLTENRGEELCRSFRAAFPVRIFLLQEKGQELTVKRPASGQKWPGSWMRYDRASSTWRIAQHSLFGDSDEFSETWPRWGLMHNGECWGLSTPAHLTNGNESGLWPTPQAYKTTESGEIINSDGTPWDGISKPHSAKSGKPITTALADAVRKFPTPTSSMCTIQDFEQAKFHSSKRPPYAECYPTPCAQDAKNSTLPVSQRDRDSIPGYLLKNGEQPGGQLNPTWVEWLMGWPLGWTDLKPLAMDKFQQWRQMHGRF